MSRRIPNETVNLERRAAPQQKRSQERIQQILDATQRLFAFHAPQSITTSDIAKEADIPISSVYRYFPNIYAIYVTIFEQFKKEADEIVELALANTVDGEWKQTLVATFGKVSALLESNDAYSIVFQYTFSSAEFSAVRDEWNHRLASHLAERWRNGLDGFSDGNPDAVARTIVEINCSIQIQLLRLKETPEIRDELYNEAIVVLESYLSRYLT